MQALTINSIMQLLEIINLINLKSKEPPSDKSELYIS